MPAEAWSGLAFPVLAPLRGISPALPPPTGAGEERRRRGRGGRDRRAVQGEMPTKSIFRVASPRLRFSGCAPPGLSPREPPLLRGSPVEGLYGSLCRGGGSLPEPLPMRYLPRSGGWDDTGEMHNPGRHPRQAFPGIPLRSGVWDDAGEGRNQGRHSGPAFLVLAPLLGISRLLPPSCGGGGERRAVHDEMPAKCTLGAGIPRPAPRATSPTSSDRPESAGTGSTWFIVIAP